LTVPWSRDRLCSDIVEGSWQERDEYWATGPRDEGTLIKRILRVLDTRNGYLNTRNILYGPHREALCQYMHALACEKGIHWVFKIRSTKLDMYQLDCHTENHNVKVVAGLAHLLAQNPVLSSIKFDGSEGESSNQVTHLGILLRDGLAKNRYGRLRSLKFHDLYLRDEGSSQVQSIIIDGLGTLTTLKELEIYDCSVYMVRLICQGLMKGQAVLETVTITSRYDGQDIAALLLSPPLTKLKSLRINFLSTTLLEPLSLVTKNLSRLSLTDILTRDDRVSVGWVLRHASHVKMLELQGIEAPSHEAPDADAIDELGSMICNMSSLESLIVNGPVSPESILQCLDNFDRVKFKNSIHWTPMGLVGCPCRR